MKAMRTIVTGFNIQTAVCEYGARFSELWTLPKKAYFPDDIEDSLRNVALIPERIYFD
jgi:hypothetical protein